MGTLRGDNGGGERPQDGGLPDLPPEWGTVIIPDDPGALDDEGTPIRRQFRRAAMRRRWRRMLRLQPEPLRQLPDDDSPGLAVPMLIMFIAVVATLVSLFAVAWPGNRPRTSPQVPRSSPLVAVSLGNMSVRDSAGNAVPLRGLIPAVVLLVEGCSCEQLITGTVEAVEAGSTPTVTVLVVAARVPTLPSGLTTVRPDRPGKVVAYADPNGALRAGVPSLAADRTTAAILVAADGHVVRAVSSVTAAADFGSDLPKLATSTRPS